MYELELIVDCFCFDFFCKYLEMGCLGSKDRLTKEDMEFLKTHTRYDEVTIKEWYKGFKVSSVLLLSIAVKMHTLPRFITK